jgi:glycosyltransferase involved in cell wall biosynthesis|tara:strand:- start:177 stop:803 length:627 start_codon:yes stop_codon:yes gene_type:complete
MKSKFPTASIIITNHNYAKYLQRCVRSCLSQRHIPVEVIVVDDLSDDDSISKLQPFEDDIKIIKNFKNVGVAESANIGIKESRSQFVIRVDADDFVASEMCYFMTEYLELNHDAFCVSCDYLMVDNYENTLERKYAKEKNISCGIMYRRDLLLELGGYNPTMRHKEEEELRKRLGKKYKIHHMGMPFYRYRMHDDNKTKSKEYSQTKI